MSKDGVGEWDVEYEDSEKNIYLLTAKKKHIRTTRFGTFDQARPLLLASEFDVSRYRYRVTQVFDLRFGGMYEEELRVQSTDY